MSYKYEHTPGRTYTMITVKDSKSGKFIWEDGDGELHADSEPYMMFPHEDSAAYFIESREDDEEPDDTYYDFKVSDFVLVKLQLKEIPV